MINFKRLKTFLLILFLFTVAIIVPRHIFAFTFVAWGDTKSDLNVLKNLSNQAKVLNPAFTLYAGDLEGDGFTQAGMDAWKVALNGGVSNGLFDKTFPVRGNHDDHLTGSSANWQNYYNLSATVTNIGGTNYTALSDDLTYSFDYANSRFIGIDVPGSSSLMSSAQIAWLDQRLTDAEARGLTHAFLFWHGPFYPMAEHCCANPPAALVNVINKHPIVTASFHGHEHIISYTVMTGSKVPGLTLPFVQVIAGDAGAGPNTATAGRYDYWLDLGGANVGGFGLIDVSGNTVNFKLYKGGSTSPQFTTSITKGSISPYPTSSVPTPTPSPRPTPTTTPRPTSTPSPLTPTPQPSILPTATPPTANTPTPAPFYIGDANGDGLVNEIDYSVLQSSYGRVASGGASVGDFNNDYLIDGVDYTIWMNTFMSSASVTATPTPAVISPTIRPTASPVPTSTPVPTPTLAPNPTPTPAGGSISLIDNFNDNSLNLTLWKKGVISGTADGNVTVNETNGQLQITPRANYAAGAYNGLISVSNYDLTGKYLYAKVVQVANSSTDADTDFFIAKDSANTVGIVQEHGFLYFYKNVNGAYTNLASISYSPSTHLWWRLRESVGKVYFDTSADGSTWSNRYSTPSPFSLLSVKIGLIAGTWDSISSPGKAIFDNINTQ